MNDVTYVEASRVLAQRMMEEGGQTSAERIAFAYKMLTARTPGSREAEILVEGFQHYLRDYRNDRAAALELVTQGEHPRNPALGRRRTGFLYHRCEPDFSTSTGPLPRSDAWIPGLDRRLSMTRRHFFGLGSAGIGTAALATLLDRSLLGKTGLKGPGDGSSQGGLSGLPHFTPKAKRVIYLFQSGAPSQMDLFDYKPKLGDLAGTELPDSIRKGQRLTGMTATQSSFSGGSLRVRV